MAVTTVHVQHRLSDEAATRYCDLLSLTMRVGGVFDTDITDCFRIDRFEHACVDLPDIIVLGTSRETKH